MTKLMFYFQCTVTYIKFKTDKMAAKIKEGMAAECYHVMYTVFCKIYCNMLLCLFVDSGIWQKERHFSNNKIGETK